MAKLPRIPVLKPSAQTASLCAVRSISNATTNTQQVSDTLPSDIAPAERAVILLMEGTGIRISEALNIKRQHVSNNGTIIIKALKGSNDRLIYAGAWSKWFVNNRMSLPLSLQGYNRFYFYRLFVKYGIYAKIGKRDKNSVTHFFRHKLAAELRTDHFENENIALALGHKKQINSDIYGK